MSNESALKAVMTLVACYPNSNPSDQFVKMASKALEDYSDSLLAAMCDPKTGIVTQSQYLPSISAMVDWVRNYAPTRPKPVYVSLPTPPPASQESKDRIDAIRASLPFMQKQHPPQVTESDLERLKEKYANLPPPKFSEQALKALNEANQISEMYGRRPVK